MGLFNKTKKSTISNSGQVKQEKTTPAEKPVKAETTLSEKKITPLFAKTDNVYGVLISPLITEKSTREEQFGKYTFAVAVTATKNEISKAVAACYGVKPVKVNVLNRLGKYKRFGRYWGQRKDWRQAVVTLPKGKSINVYETNK